jgi:hypothetical protein
MPIDELVRQFEACTLPSGAWTHAAHLSVALWYLRGHSRDEATRLIRAGIQRYNAANNNGLAYHETITLAWIEILSAFLSEHDRNTSLIDLQRELLARCGDKNHLLRFYSSERLFSETARQQWLPPDVAPSDFFGNA